MDKKEKDWRKKAIEYLEESDDPDIRKAIIILRDGKGYLTCCAPIMIKFFCEL